MATIDTLSRQFTPYLLDFTHALASLGLGMAGVSNDDSYGAIDGAASSP